MHLVLCDKTCKSSCKNGCDKMSGLCCHDTYYQAFDNVKNSYECRHCPVNCLNCKGPTYCTSCKPDHWGKYCQHKCIGCASDCTDHGCITCRIGFYSQRVSDGYRCIKCLDNCKICINGTTCDKCDYGYIIYDGKCYQGNITFSCPVNCKNGICEQNEGLCTEGCLDGWSGQTCNETCSSGCLNCTKQDSTDCGICEIGFYGESCQFNCSRHCIYEQSSCDKDSGTCDYGCAAGYWGRRCTETCGKGCNKSVCNIITGECLHGCSLTYYGIHCSQECNDNCQQKALTLRQCNAASGECLNGCTKGYYGTDCSLKCSSDCGTQLCFQRNGACITDIVTSASTTSSSTGIALLNCLVYFFSKR